MLQQRPPLSVFQGPEQNSRPLRPIRSRTTSAAWHRANSYLETISVFPGEEDQPTAQFEHQALSSPTKILQAETSFSFDRNDGVEDDVERQPLLPTSCNSPNRAIQARSEGSTLAQTVLNSMNSLLGVGLLSLPLGFQYAGWIIGSILLLFFAVVTSYTAILLSKCMKMDSSCKSYVDVARRTYGSRGRAATIILFGLLTITACVALIILFADSMNALLPVLTVFQWKLVCGLILLPLHFAPFRILSMASILGIGASAITVIIVISAGLATHSQPGSLRNPVDTSLLPADWSKLPLSLGLLMSPWTGHTIFPNLYKDMSEPAQFRKAMSYTFSLTYLIDVALATSGYLMYGELTTDEITYNVISSSHNRGIAIALTILVAIMPITKVPLSARPLVTMTEYALGLVDEHAPSEQDSPKMTTKEILLHASRYAVRVLWVIILVLGAAIAPDFRLVMAFMGSAMCYTIAIILPLLFYMKMFAGKLSLIERLVFWILLSVSSVLALIGTVWALGGEQLAGPVA